VKLIQIRAPLVNLAVGFGVALLAWPSAGAEPTLGAEFRSRFLQLCDLASGQLMASTNKQPFFIDSYAVRALCVAYDLTGKQEYLDACRAWSERMVAHQEKMLPHGAYYMNYGRKPGEDKGAWYVADSSSIAMGVLATAVRCNGPGKRRFLDSAKSFTVLVMDNYVGPSGGIRNGLWPKFDGEWWCSSGIFASLAFLLYNETGDERYLKTGLGAVDWVNALDAEKDRTYPLSEMGPTYPMYVLEGYSAGISHLKPGTGRRKAALARISWYLDWIASQQSKPPRERQWPADVRWGMKFGGLPFHQYVYSGVFPDGQRLSGAADREMQSLAGIVFANQPQLTQLAVFMMMSYAERVSPAIVYRSSDRKPVKAR